ncbi:HD domain-containing protein [Thermosulfurimonas marina]|uniref:HD domain-containing protein n=2 Tax=Thermosulfurimonas marina TaxID=2047767 RepID=A0A6H1WS43_9BACT|nr:HD domain-containing phosphohydrolase [Thermosulfurimonas marina]QJA06001.1 HD domain-containing protein [Thermosulfurimonas marina]
MSYPALAEHQLRVSYLARILGREVGFSGKELEALVIAGALHDLALFTSVDKKLALEEDPQTLERHARWGYALLRGFPYLRRSAEFILHHHAPWQILKEKDDQMWALGSNILRLADTLEIRSRELRPLLFYRSRLLEDLNSLKGSEFAPEVIEALHRAGEKELFWLRLENFSKEREVIFQTETATHLPCDQIEFLTRLFALIIDLKSPFTRIHSAGVAAVTDWLAEVLGFRDFMRVFLRVAAYLHDLGKLAVPEAILNKPGHLTEEEWAVMKAHPFYTFRILEEIPNLEMVNYIASAHHERLDGRGYPAKLSAPDLSLGARVLAVADVTTALLEDRPYRKGFLPEKARGILGELSGSALDPEIVSLVVGNMEYVVNLIRYVEEKRLEQLSTLGYWESKSGRGI